MKINRNNIKLWERWKDQEGIERTYNARGDNYCITDRDNKIIETWTLDELYDKFLEALRSGQKIKQPK